MPKITYQGKAYSTEPDETVLNTLRRNGVLVPYSCGAGACHTCMLHCQNGKVTAQSQRDLKPALKSLNYFLACQCTPDADIEVALPDDEDVYVSARCVEKQQLSPTVWRFKLETAVPVFYHAGQFVNLKNDDGEIRSYSIASLPVEDQYIEIQVRRMPDGLMSHWMADKFDVDMHIDLEGPNGHCIYTDGNPDMPILMVGTGTGLAPLIGVLRDALHQNHAGDIYLYHGARVPDEIYLHNELKELSGQHENVHYYGCVSGDDVADDMQAGRAADVAMQQHPDLKGYRLFLCGAPTMVREMRKNAFLAGASMADISADAFTAPEHEK